MNSPNHQRDHQSDSPLATFAVAPKGVIPARVYRQHSVLTWLVTVAIFYVSVPLVDEPLVSQLAVAGVCVMLGLLVGMLRPPIGGMSKALHLFAWMLGMGVFAIQLIWCANLFFWLLSPLLSWIWWVNGKYPVSTITLRQYWWRAALVSLLHAAILTLLALLVLFLICAMA